AKIAAMSERLKNSGWQSSRTLSADEHALWSHVTRAVTRLRPTVLSAPEPSGSEGRSQMPTLHSPSPAQPAQSRRSAPLPKEPPLAFDRKLKQRLARGHETIDGRIDLHGFNQAQAHDALVRFLRHGRAQGMRTVLVITGKGCARGEEWSDERG